MGLWALTAVTATIMLTEDSTNVGSLVVVGIGAAGLAMFLSGVAMLFASRRPAPQVEEARS